MTRPKSVPPSRPPKRFYALIIIVVVSHTAQQQQANRKWMAEVDTSAEHEISKPFEKCSETLFNTRLSAYYNNIHKQLLSYASVCVGLAHAHAQSLVADQIGNEENSCFGAMISYNVKIT